MGSDDHGCGAFKRVADERRSREVFSAGAQHIGGADVAGADFTDVLRAGEAGDDEPERDGAGQVAERECDGPRWQGGQKGAGIDHGISRSGGAGWFEQRKRMLVSLPLNHPVG